MPAAVLCTPIVSSLLGHTAVPIGAHSLTVQRQRDGLWLQRLAIASTRAVRACLVIGFQGQPIHILKPLLFTSLGTAEVAHALASVRRRRQRKVLKTNF